MDKHSNTQIAEKKDRAKKYLKGYLSEYKFDELSGDFIEKLGVKGLMEGVPVPFTKNDIEMFQLKNEINTSNIAENMSIVIGIDPEFKYVNHYMAFLIKLYSENLFKQLTESAANAIKDENLELACILFRAMLLFNETSVQGMYGYAKMCRDIYLKGGDEELVGSFKAESIEYFELLTVKHSEFLPAYYFLGYAYLNLGLYTKANLTWQYFVDNSETSAEKTEIQDRLKQLEIPVKLENGCNDIMAGRYEEGILKLEPYTESNFNTWWPLFYYLGIAYSRLGEIETSIANFKRVLLINPGHIDTMNELADNYSVKNDEQNYQKYIKKIELIKSQME